jgi:hypothetical protein
MRVARDSLGDAGVADGSRGKVVDVDIVSRKEMVVVTGRPSGDSEQSRSVAIGFI